jgi:hypothetical protein
LLLALSTEKFDLPICWAYSLANATICSATDQTYPKIIKLVAYEKLSKTIKDDVGHDGIGVAVCADSGGVFCPENYRQADIKE